MGCLAVEVTSERLANPVNLVLSAGEAGIKYGVIAIHRLAEKQSIQITLSVAYVDFLAMTKEVVFLIKKQTGQRLVLVFCCRLNAFQGIGPKQQ